MVVSSCKFLSTLVFKSHPIVIRMDDTTFLATWDDDTSNVGIVNLTKAELQEFTTSTGSDKGEHITSMLIKYRSHWYRVCAGLSEVRREIPIKADDLVFELRLRFDICCMASEERSVPQIEKDSSLLYYKSMCHIS